MTPEAMKEREAIVAMLKRGGRFEGCFCDMLRLAWYALRAPDVIATAFAKQNADTIQRGDHITETGE